MEVGSFKSVFADTCQIAEDYHEFASDQGVVYADFQFLQRASQAMMMPSRVVRTQQESQRRINLKRFISDRFCSPLAALQLP